MTPKKKKKYRLVDAWRRHQRYPDTFEIPSKDALDLLAPGDFVKLIFDNKERMWVKIVSWDGMDGEGVLYNTPLDLPKLQHGDTVVFADKNIIDVMSAETQARIEVLHEQKRKV